MRDARLESSLALALLATALAGTGAAAPAAEPPRPYGPAPSARQLRWHELARGTAIGSRRLWRGADVTATRVRLRLTKAPACPAISELALHRQPPEAR